MLVAACKYRDRKKYLVWSDEPYLSRHFVDRIQYPLMPKLHVLNVYTGIYRNNYRWLPDKVVLKPLEQVDLQSRKIVAVMGYGHREKQKILKKNSQLISINHLRVQLALEGHRRGILDIYGRGWPDGISKGESRGGNWRSAKQQILHNYRFNLAFENTTWKHYCTEKMWDAIQAGCLPIYYGKGNSIYEDFPRESFIDFCDFKSIDELFEYVQTLSEEDFIRRMNLCIDAFNNAMQKRGQVDKSLLDATQADLEKHGMQVGFMSDLAEVTAKRIKQIFA